MIWASGSFECLSSGTISGINALAILMLSYAVLIVKYAFLVQASNLDPHDRITLLRSNIMIEGDT